jgi:gas vesicle protein
MKDELAKKNNTWMLISLLGSGIVGAGLGILFAPKIGKETRNDIKEFAARARDTVGKTIDDGVHVYERGKNAVASAINCGTAAFAEEDERRLKAV